MQVIPVLDLKQGLVVRAAGGDRRLYAPVRSRLVDSARPLDVARAFRREYGLERLYLADLDAIAGAEPTLDLYRELSADGFALLVDAGLRSAAPAEALLGAGVDVVVAGLETLPAPGVLKDLVCIAGAEKLLFSLDLKDGKPVAPPGAWPESSEEVAALASGLGVRWMLLLELAAVGTGGGPRHLDLCRTLKKRFPGLRLLGGGGVRGRDDLLRCREAGFEGMLVAAALHDGRLSRADLDANA